MYTSFSVKNFRVFKDLAFDDLARVNLIAGMNNTGKTSLLEAILFHTGEQDYERLLRSVSTQDLRFSRRPVSRAPRLNTIFHDFDISLPIIMNGETSRDAKSWQIRLDMVEKEEVIDDLPRDLLRRVNLLNRDRDGEIALQNIQAIKIAYNEVAEDTSPHYAIQYEGRIFDDRAMRRQLPSVFIHSRDRVLPETDAELFSKLDLSGDVGVLLDTLKIIEPRLKNVRLLFLHDIPNIYGDIGLREIVPLPSMGEGMNRITSLVLGISAASDGVVLIDEVENGLHYSVQQTLWKALYEAAKHFNVQLFATTHSYEMIRAAHLAFNEMGSDDFRLHRLDRRKQTGEIERVTYTRETLEAALDIALEVR